MQILVIFFLAALVGCFGDKSQCVENAESCVADFLQSIMERSSQYKQCKELSKSIECLEGIVESCVGDEDEDKVKEGIEELKAGKEELCSVIAVLSEDDEKQKCYEAHQEYIIGCFLESTAVVLERLADQSDAEDIEDRMKCGLYMHIGECALKRLSETCGAETAMEAALTELNGVPVEIVNACKAVGIDLGPGIFNEGQKKK